MARRTKRREPAGSQGGGGGRRRRRTEREEREDGEAVKLVDFVRTHHFSGWMGWINKQKIPCPSSSSLGKKGVSVWNQA